MNIYQNIFRNKKKKTAVLVDPEKITLEKAEILAQKIQNANVDMILVGGSLVNQVIDDVIDSLKKQTSKPIILFPGSVEQFSKKADGLLLLSLISGRNPEYLIGAHVRAAMQIKNSNVEVIPTGYILIDGGKTTAVEYISNTMPMPNDKPELVCSTALAGSQLGLKAIYLEAGSGAKIPVSEKIIQSVRKTIDLPIIVGGGLRSKENIQKAFDAGADIVVIGTAIEDNLEMLKIFE